MVWVINGREISSSLLDYLVEFALYFQVQLHLFQEGPFSVFDVLALADFRLYLFLRPSSWMLLFSHALVVGLVVVFVVFVFLLLIHAVCGDETVLICLLKNVVCEEHSELVSPDPWTFRHVVNISGLNYF